MMENNIFHSMLSMMSSCRDWGLADGRRARGGGDGDATKKIVVRVVGYHSHRPAVAESS